jgi:DNA replication protein DnaC
MIHALLKSCLKELHLPTFRETYKEQAEMARAENLGHEQYLLAVAEGEVDARRIKRTERYRRDSKLPIGKTFDSFEIKRLGPKLASHLSVLRDGSFLGRNENVLAFGNPGSGKTHLLCALGHELVNAGYRIMFRSCNILVQELLYAKRELRLPKLFRALSRYDAIIIDDIGYVEHNKEEMEVLFTLLADRYERGSILLSSNLPFSKWERIFKDPMTTAAAIDRLVHHSVILELNLPSYRLEKSKNNQAGRG